MINAPEKDWRVLVATDFGPQAERDRRWCVRGENLNHAEDCMNRQFTWYFDHPPTDPRYDMSVARWDNPTALFVDLRIGDRFRHAGYPDAGFATYVKIDSDRYRCEREEAYRFWTAPPGFAVVSLPRLE